jgi:hypothetical protein
VVDAPAGRIRVELFIAARAVWEVVEESLVDAGGIPVAAVAIDELELGDPLIARQSLPALEHRDLAAGEPGQLGDVGDALPGRVPERPQERPHPHVSTHPVKGVPTAQNGR